MNNKIYSFFLLIILTCNMMAQEVFCRFKHDNQFMYGKVSGRYVLPLSKAPWNDGKVTGTPILLSTVELVHPSEPRVILGLGGSYRNSWKGKEPYKSVRWFLKPASASASPGDTIYIPEAVDVLKVEAELGIIIGKTIKNASESEAKKAIFGYVVVNDITGLTDSYHEKQGEPNDQREPLLGPGLKLGDRFSPFGPFIYTNIDWKNRERKIVITDALGKVKTETSNNTSNLVYPPEKIVSDLSKVLTLSPGDVIMTGTDGSYEVIDGDTVCISVEGLGTLTNTIKK
ncbi:MAG: fumarylacetoacetate hydrolase family protein [Flavobacteriaceae bacterium]|nr:fumarylacetoacetate hydrolase family protein [Flavobacteriaceae bacterium]